MKKIKTNEKATIYDYARLCRTEETCENCPLCVKNNGANLSCDYLLTKNPDKANEIIRKWCDEHPGETRQDRFLKMFPSAMKDEDIINIDPCTVDKTLRLSSYCSECAKQNNVENCVECRKKYWIAEVDE